MKYLKTFKQLNELKSFENYSAVNFISDKISKKLTELFSKERKTINDVEIFTALSGRIDDKELINELSETLIDSTIEYYDIEDNNKNRKKIKSKFHFYYNIVQDVQLHVNNKKRDFASISYRKYAKQQRSPIQYSSEFNIVSLNNILNILLLEIEKLFPEETKNKENKEILLKPYTYTNIGNSDTLKKNIYDWNFTFDFLERVLYDFIHENVSDKEYNEFKDIIDESIDYLKVYVEEKEYKQVIVYNRIELIEPLNNNKLTDRNYLDKYLMEIRDFFIDEVKNDTSELFTKLLNRLRNFITNNDKINIDKELLFYKNLNNKELLEIIDNDINQHFNNIKKLSKIDKDFKNRLEKLKIN